LSRLLVVRHGQAAAGWDCDIDPGLDEVGRAQAEAVADRLSGLRALPVVVSPRRRTMQTAAPLARRWGIEPRVEPRIGEIATPDGLGLADRGTWLRDVMDHRWPDLDSDRQAWRQGVLDALWSVEGDAVIVTHFVAINVMAGWAAGDDRVVTVSPANCSITVFDVDPETRGLALVSG
jgi:broad specificity phosphatase PhoE